MIMLNKENKGMFVLGSCVFSLSFQGSSFSLQPSSLYGFQFSFFIIICILTVVVFSLVQFLFFSVYFLKLLLALT